MGFEGSDVSDFSSIDMIVAMTKRAKVPAGGGEESPTGEREATYRLLCG